MGQPSTIIHDFNERLEWSQQLSDEPEWIAFYRRLWPNALYIIRADRDSQWQRWGVDRRITLPNGRDILIDEKKRAGDWDDVLLEEWSVYYGDGDRRNKIGWALDESKRIDFVAYAIPKRGLCYLLPFELTRLAYVVNRATWHAESWQYPKDAKNNGYITRNCAVPWQTLKSAITQQILRKYGDTLVLPVPHSTTPGQIEFEWGCGGRQP
jgi:hypothetical protein